MNNPRFIYINKAPEPIMVQGLFNTIVESEAVESLYLQPLYCHTSYCSNCADRNHTQSCGLPACRHVYHFSEIDRPDKFTEMVSKQEKRHAKTD